jgi:hypothetical protein
LIAVLVDSFDLRRAGAVSEKTKPAMDADKLAA